jgi:hypothetical protein
MKLDRFATSRYWPLVTLIAAPTLLLLPVVLGGVLYWGVPLMQFYPWQKLAAEMWRAGQLPLWNPLVGGGAPLAANLQTGAFYPGNFLHLIVPTEYALGYTALLHVSLAGLFMYAYLRTLKLSTLAATLGALAFQLNGFLIARLGFMSITVTLPWLAAWLWRVEKLVIRDRGSGIRETLWLALAIGLGVLAGHAQTAVYGLVLVGTYFVWRALNPHANPPPFATATNRGGAWSSRRHATLSFVGFAIAVMIGLGLAAIQLIPAAELTRESQRAGGLESIKVLTHSYWPPRLLTLLSPDFFGNPAQNNFWGYDNYWENAAYIGVLPLVLAMWMMGQRIKDWGSGIRRRVSESANQQMGESSLVIRYLSLVKFFSLGTLVSLVLAFGWFTPIYVWLYENVPGFDLFQGPARWLVVTIPALCVLAALGAQRWLDHGFSRRAANRLILAGLALVVAGIGALFVLSGRFGPATLRLGGLLSITGWLFRLRIRDRKPMLMVVGVVALDLISAHFALNPVLSAAVYHAPNPAADAIKADGLAGRIFYFDSDESTLKFGTYLARDRQFTGYGPNDLTHWLNFRQTLLPNLAMIDGLASANNFDSLIIGRYLALLDQINAAPFDAARLLLDQLNVTYIASPRSLDLPIVYRADDVTIYRNDQALPRARIVLDLAANGRITIAPESSIKSLTDSGNTVTIRAVSPMAGYLVLADVYYPGWHAWVDGTQVPIELANTAFRAVKLTVGEHVIEFRYEPASVQTGAALTVVSGLIVLSGWILTQRPSAKRGRA